MSRETDTSPGTRRPPRSLLLIVVMALVAPGAAPPPALAADAPKCSDCHDAEAEFKASVHGKAEVECVSCHSDLAGVEEFPHQKPAPVDCKLCHEVKVSTNHPPTCADCHGAHTIKKIAGSPRSASADRISASCGTCHEEIVGEFMDGIHGRELAKGDPSVPTCLTCHGGHAIMLNEDPNSPVSPASLAHTCARCHDDEEIARKYGLPPARLQTFVGSFHGLASEYGERDVANCVSCHGTHRILQSSDPKSMVNAANLPATCGRCHENAGRHFADGKVHVEDRWEDNRYAYVARRFYQGTIGAMMTIFAVFMVVDFTFRRRRRSEERARESGERP